MSSPDRGPLTSHTWHCEGSWCDHCGLHHKKIQWEKKLKTFDAKMNSGFILELCVVVKCVTEWDQKGPLMAAQNRGRYAQVTKATADTALPEDRPQIQLAAEKHPGKSKWESKEVAAGAKQSVSRNKYSSCSYYSLPVTQRLDYRHRAGNIFRSFFKMSSPAHDPPCSHLKHCPYFLFQPLKFSFPCCYANSDQGEISSTV